VVKFLAELHRRLGPVTVVWDRNQIHSKSKVVKAGATRVTAWETLAMWLTTEETGETPHVTAEDIDRILPADGFGKFAILSASENSFIQAGNDWQPGEECRAFLRDHGSDPWVLEYRDGESGRQYRAIGHVTLDQVRQAFLSYLSGSRAWREMLGWREMSV
jgi:hypothetical protein